MENKNNCPVLVAAAIASGNPLSFNTDCGEEKCAWWMPKDSCCAIAVLAASNVVTSEALNTEIQVVNYRGS